MPRLGIGQVVCLKFLAAKVNKLSQQVYDDTWVYSYKDGSKMPIMFCLMMDTATIIIKDLPADKTLKKIT